MNVHSTAKNVESAKFFYKDLPSLAVCIGDDNLKPHGASI